MQPNKIVPFLRTVPIFIGLDPPTVERVASMVETRQFDADETVVDHHQVGQELMIVVEGELQALLPNRHLEVENELVRLYPGDYFGLSSLFTKAMADVKVRGLEAGRLLVLKRESLDELSESVPHFAKSMCRSLATQFATRLEKIPSIPFVRLDDFPAMANASAILPKPVARSCRCLVVERDKHQAKLAMVDPYDQRSRSFLQSVLNGYQLQFVAITEDDFSRHRGQLLDEAPGLPDVFVPLEELVFLNDAGQAEPIAETSDHDLLHRVLSAAVQNNASDVHIEPGLPTGRVRMRIDGRLVSIEDRVPVQVLRQIISRVKVMSDLNITNVRRPQDGRLVVMSGDRRIEMRTAAMPCQGGEKVVLRVNQANNQLSSLANLFVFESVQRFAEDILRQPSGLVLVTGPTGAGKTTTLYAALEHLNRVNDTHNFVTIEDPIEYDLPFATQSQVSRELDLGFAQILRAVLRQDADVILVGEMRDAESAAIAVEAATTGHLVLSTLHTHSTLETLVRLRNLKIKPYMLADALKGIVSQKLVRRLAPGFTDFVSRDDASIHALKEVGVLPNDWGLPLCRGRQEEGGPPGGEGGRVAVFELMSCTDQIRQAIEDGAPQSEIRAHLTPETYLPMKDYSRMLLADHYVSPERILEIFPKQAQYQGG